MSEQKQGTDPKGHVSVECCHHCPDRHVGCHGTCQRYKDATELREKKKAWLKEMNKAILGKKVFDKRLPKDKKSRSYKSRSRRYR